MVSCMWLEWRRLIGSGRRGGRDYSSTKITGGADNFCARKLARAKDGRS
jgi:hypothetical protein